MIAFPAQFTHLFLLIISSFFIVSGIVMVSYGIHENINLAKEISEKTDDKQSSGFTTIFSGVLDIIIGVCGVVGILLNKRLLIMANSALLCAAILGHLVILIFVAMSKGEFTLSATKNMSEAITNQYGNNSVDAYRAFTVAVDKHQAEENCCGWSGVDNENLFLKSPWFAENVKTGNSSVVGKVKVIPDSCCITAGSDCTTTSDLKQARLDGRAFRTDCLDKMIFELVALGFSLYIILQPPV